MLRRIPRFLRVSIVIAMVAVVTLTVYQSWSSGAVGTGGWTQTQWGPLGPADRDLLVKVRQANLWEGPTGQQAAQQASSPAVREVGQHLATEHADLDAQTRKVADQLGVLLPTSRTAGELACCSACWPVGVSHRPAWRTRASRSRSAGPSGPHCVCVQPPVPGAPVDQDW